jgi:hypothetical protein
MNGQNEHQNNWQQFSDQMRNREKTGANFLDESRRNMKDEEDIEQVETTRQKRRERQSKTQIKFILTNGNPSKPIIEAEQPPQPETFQTPKKAKTRAERRSEEDLSDDEVNEPITLAKRVRRSNHWVVQDTQRINRSRRLKQLETIRSLSFDLD